MATEALSPDAVLLSDNYSSLALSVVQQDPDTSGTFGTWDGNGDTIASVSLPTPSGDPTVGVDLQENRARIQKDATGGNAVDWSLEVWEDIASVPTQLAVLATGTTTSLTGETVSGTWNASLLTDATGANVEVRMVQTAGGSGNPSLRRGLEVGGIEWNVEFSSGITGTVAETQAAQTEAIAAEGIAEGVLAETHAAQTETITGDAVVEGVLAETAPAQTDAATAETIGSGVIAETAAPQVEDITAIHEAATGTIIETAAPQTETITAIGIAGGALAEQQAPQTEASTAAAIAAGSLAEQQAAQTDAATAAAIAVGTLTETQAPQTEAITALAPASGGLTETQAPQTETITAVAVAAGALTEAQAPQTEGITATAVIAGALTETSAPQTDALSATALVVGAIVEQQAPQVEAILGSTGADIDGVIAEQQPSQTEAISADAVASGSLIEQQAPQTEAVTGQLIASGTIAEQQAPQVDAATATTIASGSIAETNAPQTEAILASAVASGALVEAQAPQTETAVAIIIASGSLTEQQAPQTDVASAIIIIAGSLVETAPAAVESIYAGGGTPETYTYDIATDTLNGRVNLEVLARAVLNAGLTSGGALEGLRVLDGAPAGSGVINGGTLQVSWASSLSVPDEMDQDALVANHAGDAFEEGPASAESLGVSTTTASATKLSLSLGPIAEGMWRFEGSGEIRVQAVIAGSRVVARVLLDGTPLIAQSSDLDEFTSFSAAVDIPMEAGAEPVLEIQFLRAGTSNTVEIRRARISIYQTFW